MSMDQLPVALQLYTVRDQTARDFVGTLRQIAAIGYAGVEFAGFGGLPAQELRDLLAEIGLQSVSAHLGLGELQDDRLDASIAYCRAIGCSALVLPYLDAQQRAQENLPQLAASLNAIGERCAQAGFTFAYHNHDFEFTMVHGQTWLNTLFEATDPALVKCELDVYWSAFAGHDPLALLQCLGERVALIHCKDMAEDRSMTEVGQGVLDMQGIINFACDHQLWAIVEHDHPALPSLESARISLSYFQAR